MSYDAPPPPAIVVQAPIAPPIAFLGFRPGMPLAEVQTLLAASGGRLACRTAADPRIKECTGTMGSEELGRPLDVLISAVHDSAAVISLAARTAEHAIAPWVRDLGSGLGPPLVRIEPGREMSWEWVRKGKMLRITERKADGALESAVTYTDGPLLDSLGPPELKRPN